MRFKKQKANLGWRLCSAHNGRPRYAPARQIQGQLDAPMGGIP